MVTPGCIGDSPTGADATCGINCGGMTRMQFDIQVPKVPGETAMSAVDWQRFGTQRTDIAVVTHLGKNSK